MTNVLFICSQNRLRSLTAEQVFSTWHGVETVSAGTNHDAENPVTPELLRWADLIFAMERTHKTKLRQRFKSALNGKNIICLGIRDEYAYMEPALIEILEAKIPKYFPPGCKPAG